MDVVFRTSSPSEPVSTESTPNEPNIYGSTGGDELVSDNSSDLLDILGVQDDLRNLDSASKNNLDTIDSYIKGIMEKRGLEPTKSSLNKVLGEVKEEMGLDSEVSADMAIERIGNVLKAYRDLAFIKDPKEKRSIFMKLARLETAKDINKAVYETMDQYKVWQ